MDKEAPYETFQFIETGNEANPDIQNQLIVLQEDGTLVSVNRDIQYITQVQDDKEEDRNVQTCAVYDVSLQQFYVNVDNQFEIHQSDGNIYPSSFLIQAETSTATEPMDTAEPTIPSLNTDSTTQSEVELTDSSKTVNNFTEITLTDRQYHLLEQKGWILLEFNGRIFVLDTLGLHDITSDEKLINKLKSEQDGTNHLIESGLMKVENAPRPAEYKLEISIPGEKIEPGQQVEKLLTHSNLETETNKKMIETPEVIEGSNLDCQDNEEIAPSIIDTKQKCDSIKIKTKYTFTDIPDKIFLGKTVNGKKLYAKVTKSKHKEMANIKMEMRRKSFEKDKNFDAIDDFQFINIIQDFIRKHPSKVLINNVIAADTVVTQLMRIAHIRDTVMGNLIVVTKTVIFMNEDGEEKTRRKPITVTGEVKPLDDTHGRFVHSPFMLHNMCIKETPKTVKAILTEENVNERIQEFVEFVHIHVTETKTPNKPSAQTINVCNRKISLDVIRDARMRHPKPVYACGACAAVFKAQSTLEDHLENNCLRTTDLDDALTIDTDNEQTDSYYTMDTGKEKWYYCIQCEAKFSKLFNCKKHIKSHLRPKRHSDNDGAPESEIIEYKCKMCSSKYFHASSLSKHIVKMHIQVHSNKQP